MKQLYFKSNNKKSHLNNDFKNCKQLLEKFFKTSTKATFFDNTLQCMPEKNRSLKDLVWLCQSRFPKTTERTVCRALYSLGKENKLRSLYCGGLKQIVFGNNHVQWNYFSENYHYRDDYFEEFVLKTK